MGELGQWLSLLESSLLSLLAVGVDFEELNMNIHITATATPSLSSL